jgi:hypothetical protein
VTGFKNVLLDYYIEAEDNFGNVYKSEIYHVYVASGNPQEEEKRYQFDEEMNPTQ